MTSKVAVIAGAARAEVWRNGEPSWGRLFIIAKLVEPLSLTIPANEYVPTNN